jgi:phosphatidylglycerol:prolipoprotein diacylglycerol transferase
VIVIPVDPNVHIGPLTIAWHGIFTVVGILFGVAVPIRLVRAWVQEDAAYSVATWGVVAGIVGARLFHVLDSWEYYASRPEQILFIWNGGIAIMGAVIAGVLAGYVRARQLRLPAGKIADAAAPGIGLGMAIGRIGDIINGEHHATPCQGLPWCVGYSHPDTLGQPGPVHPAVAYEMVWDLVGVAGALALRPVLANRSPEGRIFWIWAVWYSIGRYFISFLRLDAIVAFDLRQAQLLSLATIVVGVPLLIWLTLRARRPQASLV